MRHFILIIYMCMIPFVVAACGAKPQMVKNGEDILTEAVSKDTENGIATADEISSSESDEIKHSVAVYVCGAVVSPGVYYLDADSIKQDAVMCAGGFAEGACEEYINLAEHIKDGEQIYIPYDEELSAGYSPIYDNVSGYPSTDKEGKLNINLAGKDELMSLSGIGEARAAAIIQYRQEHGAFKSIEEIKNISGIKDSVFNDIKDYITVD